MAKSETKQSLKKVEPLRNLTPFEEMESWFDNSPSRNWVYPLNRNWPLFSKMREMEDQVPNTDIIERDNEIIVKAELPGVDKKDLDISVTNNTVSISGSTSTEEKEEKGDYYRCEISSSGYYRTLSLPAEVDEKEAKAKFKNGILKLTLPKLKKSKRHNVQVE